MCRQKKVSLEEGSRLARGSAETAPGPGISAGNRRLPSSAKHLHIAEASPVAKRVRGSGKTALHRRFAARAAPPPAHRPSLPASHTAAKQGAPVSFPVRYSLRWYRCAAFSRSSASLRAAASSRRRRVASARSLQQAGQQNDTSGQHEAAVRGTARRRRWRAAPAQVLQSSEPAAGAGSKTHSEVRKMHQAAAAQRSARPRHSAAWHAQRSAACTAQRGAAERPPAVCAAGLLRNVAGPVDSILSRLALETRGERMRMGRWTVGCNSCLDAS